MVFLMESGPSDPPYVIALFGVQYKDVTPEKQKITSTLLRIIEASAGQVDCLLDDQEDGHNDGCRTILFVVYWASSADYQSWWSQDDVQSVWRSLPDDAGVWREVMIVPESRFMHASTTDRKTGMSLARNAKLHQSSNEGYWGVYRNRLAASKTDDLSSPYDTASTPKPASGVANKPILELVNPTGEPTSIRHGRVHIPQGIDNLAWVREYQSYVNVKEAEQEQWSKHLTPHAKAWMEHLDTERSKNGFLSFRMSIAVERAELENGSAASLKKISQMNQFVYVLDIAHFERAGKSFEHHRKLRKNMMELMGPDWAAHLMVELAVLKASEFEAEYVGCVEGTGLMFLEEIVGGKTA